MSSTSTEGVKVADTTANPAPLGLLGFGLTTLLLNIHNTGLVPLTGTIFGMGIFVGGLAQVIAGIMEWKKNNTFGTTAFIAYGFFWLTLVAIWSLPKLGLAAPADPVSMGFFLAAWGLFTLGMFVGTLRINRALQTVFLSLVGLFFLLAARDFLEAAGIEAGKTVGALAGWVGIFCGLSAFYASLAQVINETWGRTILPLGAVKK